MAKRRRIIAKSLKDEIKRQVSRFRDLASAFLSMLKTDYSSRLDRVAEKCSISSTVLEWRPIIMPLGLGKDRNVGNKVDVNCWKRNRKLTCFDCKIKKKLIYKNNNLSFFHKIRKESKNRSLAALMAMSLRVTVWML